MKFLIVITLFFFVIISPPVRAEDTELKLPVLSDAECKSAPSNAEYKRWLAEGGDSYEQQMIGTHYLALGNYAEAIKWIRKSAEGGEYAAQIILATAYAPDIAREHGRGDRWTDNGLELAQRNVLAKNYKDAAKWYRAAAEHGEYVAQRSLGYMYQEGLGVEQNYLEAYFWARLADASPQYHDTGDKQYHVYQVDKLQERHSPDSDNIKTHLSEKQITNVEKRVGHWKSKRFRNPNFLSKINVMGILCGYDISWKIFDRGGRFEIRNKNSVPAGYYFIDKQTKKVVGSGSSGDM